MKSKNFLKWRLFIFSLLALATGCVSPPSTPTPQPVVFYLPEIRRAPELESIQLKNDLSTGSMISPMLAHYLLRPQAGEFRGLATFGAGDGYFREQTIESAEITIPADVIQKFLNKLAESPLHAGVYDPQVEEIDDYPEVSISLEYSDETILFYSPSQKNGHVPWKVTIDNQDFVVDSEIPMEAWALLSPYLKQDQYEKFLDQVENSPDMGGFTTRATATP